jgi:hypothetical protein
MKTTKLSLALAGLMIASTVLVSSCKKKEEAKDTDTTGASDAHLSENTSSDIVSMGAQASDNTTANLSTYRNGNNNQILGLGCATVTRDTVAKTVTVNFGSGTTCLDGRTRSGSITYTYSNPNGSGAGYNHYRDPGFTLNVTSSNYVVDGNAVTIENKTITNTTPVNFNPATTNETWSITASITINKATGGSINWTCNRVKTLLNTASVYPSNPLTSPINWSMARVGFTGSASGSRSVGETFSLNITNQLVRDFGGCELSGRAPFIEGTFTYAPSGKKVRTFDYGTGSCDFDATVTIDGVSHAITIK